MCYYYISHCLCLHRPGHRLLNVNRDYDTGVATYTVAFGNGIINETFDLTQEQFNTLPNQKELVEQTLNGDRWCVLRPRPPL